MKNKQPAQQFSSTMHKNPRKNHNISNLVELKGPVLPVTMLSNIRNFKQTEEYEN